MKCTSANPLFLFGVALLSLLSTACSRYSLPAGSPAYTEHRIDGSIAPDTAFIAYYLPYKQQLDAEMNRVIGHSAVPLTKPGSVPETLLGNFFADALLTEGRKSDPGIDFSFGTKGGLRTELPKGGITVGHLFELMPFENELVILELSGKSVRQLAGFIAATGGQPVAGLRMVIHANTANDIRIGGTPLDDSKTYRLLTYDYLANGGDNIRGLEAPVKRVNLGQKVREALINYVQDCTREGKQLNTQLDGRIKLDE
ncbi:5'-nucleotidase C-terminal domain-containing protein [Parapedobacter lycopersici]|uniref:5'-nucleotidase C-terminal domain-containing protein n=1 Tax=Parapedobacter lycopersici TaxID=1864939 RepID=UPI00214DAF56|nr:5'-nucleotidase [Parapedobacter lycopersici]